MKVVLNDDSDPEDIYYPPNLEKLNFVFMTRKTDYPTKKIIIPDSVVEMKLKTNYPMKLFVFPKNLKKLELISPILDGVGRLPLPESLTHLIIGGTFNNEIYNIDFPVSLTHLEFGGYFNKELYLDKSLVNLTHLKIPNTYIKRLAETDFPESLTQITFTKKSPKRPIKEIYGFGFEQYSKIRKQREYVNNLPQNIKASLRWYTVPGNEAIDLLGLVREGKPIPKDKQKHLDNISLAFENVPPLEEEIILYRGLSVEPNFEYKAFVSTTVDYKTALGFSQDYLDGCCLLEIIAKPGAKLLPLVDLSLFVEQEEILLDGTNGIFKQIGSEIKSGMRIIKCTYSS